LAFCFRGLCPNGAVFADITYGFYPVFADMFNRSKTIVPLRDDFTICPEDYLGKKGTVFIANPNAPTGICLPLDSIRSILSQDRDRLVVVDEAYVDFGGESSVGLIKEFDNLIVVQTFSKSRQLAGARLAFAISNPALAAELNTLKFSFNPYSVNRAALAAGEAAMRDKEYFDKTRTSIINDRRYTTDSLRKIGFYVIDSCANFIFVSPRGISAEDYFAKLRSRGIIVRYWPNSPRIKDYLRITIGTHEQMSALVSATADILKEVN
jgi:histidinol-phosphate aminotransferase